MVRPGPKPKPNRLKLIEGNRGHRPINDQEPEFSVPEDCPKPPDFLDAYAKEEWARVSPELYATGMLTVADTSILAGYCMAYSRWRYAEEQIQIEARTSDKTSHRGMLVKTLAGNVIQNPLVGVANAARKDMVRIAAEFGMTPSSRAGLQGTGSGGKVDPTEKKFFNG